MWANIIAVSINIEHDRTCGRRRVGRLQRSRHRFFGGGQHVYCRRYAVVVVVVVFRQRQRVGRRHAGNRGRSISARPRDTPLAETQSHKGSHCCSRASMPRGRDRDSGKTTTEWPTVAVRSPRWRDGTYWERKPSHSPDLTIAVGDDWERRWLLNFI